MLTPSQWSSLGKFLSQVSDHRSPQGPRYPMPVALTLLITARQAGATACTAAAEDLPPSLAQHGCAEGFRPRRAPLWRTVIGVADDVHLSARHLLAPLAGHPQVEHVVMAKSRQARRTAGGVGYVSGLAQPEPVQGLTTAGWASRFAQSWGRFPLLPVAQAVRPIEGGCSMTRPGGSGLRVPSRHSDDS